MIGARGRHVSLAAVVFAMTAATAQAVPLTLEYDVRVFSLGPLAPIDPVTFTFEVTFDDEVSVTDETAGLTLTNLNIPLDSAPAFSFNAATDVLQLGGGIVTNLFPGTNDFQAIFARASGDPILVEFYYVDADHRGSLFHSDAVTLTPVAPSSVPEPATVSLLVAGIAGLGGREWRRRFSRRQPRD